MLALQVPTDDVGADVCRGRRRVVLDLHVAADCAVISHTGAAIVLALEVALDLNPGADVTAPRRTLLNLDVADDHNRATQKHGPALISLNIASNC